MDLRELIAAHKRGRSYEQLARDCGGVVTSQRLQQLGTTKLKAFPTTEVLKGMARGLGASEAAVVLAVAESLGLDVTRAAPRLMELLPATASTMTERQASAVAEVIRSFTEQKAGEGNLNRDAASDVKLNRPRQEARPEVTHGARGS
jgi:hypothetical protein